MAVGRVCHGEARAADAAAHGASVNSHDAAVVVGAALNGVDAHVVAHVALLDGGIEGSARDAADTVVSRNAGIGEGDAPHITALLDCSEEAQITIVQAAALIDADAADGVAAAVEGPLEAVAFSADGGVVILGAVGIVPVGGVRVGDVGTLLEELAAEVISCVDKRGQQVKVGGAADDIGSIFRTTALKNIVCDVSGVADLNLLEANAIGVGLAEALGRVQVVAQGDTANVNRHAVGVELDDVAVAVQESNAVNVIGGAATNRERGFALCKKAVFGVPEQLVRRTAQRERDAVSQREAEGASGAVSPRAGCAVVVRRWTGFVVEVAGELRLVRLLTFKDVGLRRGHSSLSRQPNNQCD